MVLSYDSYTIGWIAALPLELAPARALLDEQHGSLEGMPNDDNTYVLGRIGKHNVVITALPMGVMGTNAAGKAAKDLLRSFKNVRFGLMVGIGGGVPTGPEDVRLGDIVVSSRQGRSGGVVQYDFGTKLQYNAALATTQKQEDFIIKGYLRDPPTALQGAVANLKARSMVDGYEYHDIYEQMIANKPRMQKTFKKPVSDILYKADYIHQAADDCSVCDPANQVARSPRDESLVHHGVIGSGNQVMRDAVLRDKLYEQERIICFEMEAAGLMNDFECMVVRGICDYCDSHKNKDWQPYAAAVAAAYAKELLLTLPARQVEEMPKSKILESSTNLFPRQFLRIDSDLKKITNQNTKILVAQRSSELRRAIDWIAAPDPETNFHLVLQRKDPDTGSWIAESKAYLDWKADDIKHLWLHGKPGCGKSILAATAILDIKQLCTNSGMGFAMFYFSFADVAKQTWIDCLKSLVVQLLNGETASNTLLQAYQARKGVPTEEVLRKILDQALNSYSKVFIMLDALDESPLNTKGDDEETVRSILMSKLAQLSADTPRIKFFLTSRNEQDIETSMEALGVGSISVTPECVDRDIQKYVANQLAKDKILSKFNEEIKTDIETTLIAKAQGM